MNKPLHSSLARIEMVLVLPWELLGSLVWLLESCALHHCSMCLHGTGGISQSQLYFKLSAAEVQLAISSPTRFSKTGLPEVSLIVPDFRIYVFGSSCHSLIFVIILSSFLSLSLSCHSILPWG